MNIIMLLWWSLGRGNPVVPSRWQATAGVEHPGGRLNEHTRSSASALTAHLRWPFGLDVEIRDVRLASRRAETARMSAASTTQPPLVGPKSPTDSV